METTVDAGNDKSTESDVIDEADAALAGWKEQEEAPNLVPFFVEVEEFGPKWLEKLAQAVIDDHDSAWDNSETYRDKRKENYQILTGFLPKKTFPWDGCANAHMPLMLERYLRLVSNVYVEIFTDREAIFQVEPTGPDDQEQAEILTLHGNWQLKNELTDFSRQQLRGVGEFFACGSVFAHSYRDTVKNRNRHDTLNCEELVIPFVWTTVETDMSDVPFKIRIIRKYRNEVEALGLSGEWAETKTLIKKGPPSWESTETKVRDKAAQGEGVIAPEQNKRAPWVLYEWHGWFKMPGEDRQRPICATVDKNSKQVVKLYLREENDWRDQMRFERQTQEFAQHQAQMQQHEVDMQGHAQAMAEHDQLQQQEMQLQQAMQAPHVDPRDREAVTQALGAEALAAPTPPVPPTPPKWLKPDMQGPEPVRRVPIEMFSHGVCFENPNGTLGLSPGHVLADLNRLSDESLNRFYDSATLANVWSVLAPEGLDLGSSSVPMTPGKIFRVKNFSGQALKDAIHEFKAQPANPQLMDMVRMASDNADSSVAAPGVLSGEPGKSGETFRGISLRDQRATRQLSQAGLMYLDFLANILKNNARLNSLFMAEDELLQVGNHFAEQRKLTLDPATGQPLPALNLSRDMYRRDYRVSFTADVSFSSKQDRIAANDELLAMVTQVPPLQASPALLYAIVVKGMRLRGAADLVPTLGPAPPVPKEPFGTPPSPPSGPPPGAPGAAGPPGAPPPGGPPPGPPMPQPQGGPQ